METCPCGSYLAYSECCKPLIDGERPAETAEQLMRSRYSAYVEREIAYLFATLHPDQRNDFDEKGTRQWAESSQWHGLEILKTEDGGPADSEGKVEFIASYTMNGARREHHELATFMKNDGTWFFVSGESIAPKPVVRSGPKTGRNDPCSCGSGKKFKKCCGR